MKEEIYAVKHCDSLFCSVLLLQACCWCQLANISQGIVNPLYAIHTAIYFPTIFPL